MENLLGTQLRRFFVQLRFFEQLPDLQMAQPHEVNTSIAARRNGARGDYGVNMARNLHDSRAYNYVVCEKPVFRLTRYGPPKPVSPVPHPKL